MAQETQSYSVDFKAGYVAIIGEPNVGKSTLVNCLLGEKLSIVTPKPQTTRHKILGILSKENYQVILLDTPGLLKPKYLLQEAMMKYAYSAIEDADIVLLMIDVVSPEIDNSILKSLYEKLDKNLKKNVFLLLNKIDLVEKVKLLPIIDSYSKQYSFKEIFPISALNAIGIEELLNTIIKYLPTHPPFYPLDIISEHPERFFVSEIIREKIFEKYRDEIPYSTAVNIIEFKEQQGRKSYINAEIVVEKESQKGILIGKGGKALKEIGELARKDIELFLNRPIFLELYVKVREKWRKKEKLLKSFGYS